MTPTDLAQRIDHTLLKPEAALDDIAHAARLAIDHHVAALCIPPAWVKPAAQMLRGSGVRLCTVAGFPHGTNKNTVKAIEATVAVKDGADEIDLVAFLPNLMKLDLDAARAELSEVARAARAVRRDVVLKVIIESALLLSLGHDLGEQAIALACRAIRESGCDFVKTSSGFHPAGGASVDAVALMKQHGQALKIKAAGGIRDLATARALLDAGADRLGCSASIAILEQLQRENG